MFVIPKYKFHVPITPKKYLIVACALLLLYITLCSGTSWSWWDSHVYSRIRPIYRPNAGGIYQNIHLNISQWGERGTLVKGLIQRAETLVKNPADDRKPFQADLASLFPLMTGTENIIYTPWTPSSSSFSKDIGYVICAGSSNFHLAAHLILALRRVHGSKAEIEIAYAGDKDLRPEHRTFLANLESGISFINLLERFPAAQDDLVSSGWAMKPFALLASSHIRAVLVDADALFLTSPDAIFDTNPGLMRTGILLFHDRAAPGGDDQRRLWVKAQIEAANITASNTLQNESLFYSGATWYEADSGVVAIDKSRPSVLLGLIFATWMNTKQIRDEVSYKIFYGDKETFWVAMELSSVEYFFQPWYAGSMGTIQNGPNQRSDAELASKEVELCGTHMLHLDHLGQTPFWINGGVYERKDKPELGNANMTHYWVGETADIRLTQPNWYWIEGNISCLKEKGVKQIPDHVKRNIDMIQAEAKRVDEIIKKL